MEPAMKPRFLAFVMAVIATGLTMTVPVQAAPLEQVLVSRYPAGTISSVQVAQAALADVDSARRETEQRFSSQRAECFEKFFTSSCLADAKEERRAALHNIRKVEVEANAFLRKERANERERVIAEREGRSAKPLERPSIPITGATRDTARDVGTAADVPGGATNAGKP